VRVSVSLTPRRSFSLLDLIRAAPRFGPPDYSETRSPQRPCRGRRGVCAMMAVMAAADLSDEELVQLESLVAELESGPEAEDAEAPTAAEPLAEATPADPAAEAFAREVLGTLDPPLAGLLHTALEVEEGASFEALREKRERAAREGGRQ
jgi:hypothetical protein